MYQTNNSTLIRRQCILATVLIAIGIIVGVTLHKAAIATAEQYRLSVKIAKDQITQYDHCLRTQVGTVLAHGTVTADSFVSYEELGPQSYLQVERICEKYTRHENKDKDGNVTVSHSWDRFGSSHKVVPNSYFMNHTYQTTTLQIPMYRVNLDNIGVTNYFNYYYKNIFNAYFPAEGDLRWYYYATPNGIDGSILLSMQDDVEFLSTFYAYETPEQVIADKVATAKTLPYIFAGIWFLFMVGLVVWCEYKFRH